MFRKDRARVRESDFGRNIEMLEIEDIVELVLLSRIGKEV